MDRFLQLKVFVSVVDEGGFAAAARRLAISPPAVTRQVAALEERLGVKLLDRTTRSVKVTEAGRRYADDARQVLATMEAADDAATGINAEPRGQLTITAPVMFGRQYVTPGVTAFLTRYPDMSVDALYLDRIVSLVDEGVDVGIRIGKLPDSSLRALRVGEVRRVVVAAPGYFTDRAKPGNPQDLREHRLIASHAGSFSSSWRFSQSADHPLRLKPRFTTTTNESAIEASLQGFGITRVLSYQVADLVQAGKLQLLLSDYEPAPLPVHIVHREDRLGSVRVRAFIDLLADRLRTDPRLSASMAP